jgi:murein DD-endopeptidase MepM/ murein hydrolase activator NlpD
LKNSLYVGAHEQNNFIKYAKFTPTYEVLEKAMLEDIKSHSEDKKISWIDILAILASKYGGDFKKYSVNDMNEVTKKLKSGDTVEEITNNNKNYNYYKEVYSAVLGEFLGDYKIRKRAVNSDASGEWQEVYGLKAFSPIAKTFPFSHYDDFGASRSYGYSRPHLGHDMMAAVGTPVIAVESGTVEIIGWNQYGGWRVGIRSFDKKRYYYYAHLRQNRPFHVDLKEGAEVHAGDVIGYVGRTGYSTKENVNNIEQSHLHWGLELIFDESQKECDNEIWIDLYAITKLLEKNKSAVIRNNDTKEFYPEFEIIN